MSHVEEWIIRRPVDAALTARAQAALAKYAAFGELELGTEDGLAALTFRVAHPRLEELALTVDEGLGTLAGWDWRDDIDEADEEEDEAPIELVVELTHKVPESIATQRELTVLSVYSNDGDNRAAWPVAFALAARLAKELGAVEAEAWVDPAKLN